MKRQSLEIVSHQEWLGMRSHDITSTEVSALFGLSPYLTEFELWHRKKNREIVSIEANERMRWGNRLESAIAEGAAEDHGWKVRKASNYLRLPDLRIGSSFDYWVESNDQEGTGILEIKNVDGSQFAQHWVEDAEGNIEAPAHIELQVQHQLLVSGHDWAVIAALVGGNNIKVMLRRRDNEVVNQILAKIKAFWDSVDTGHAPAPDYKADAEFIIKSLRNKANEGEVYVADPTMDVLLGSYKAVNDQLKELEQSRDELKARILDTVGTASKIVGTSASVSCGVTDPSPGKLITADMVGLHIGARAGFRQFRFTQKKVK
jgi:putative phage-type endonuclease